MARSRSLRRPVVATVATLVAGLGVIACGGTVDAGSGGTGGGGSGGSSGGSGGTSGSSGSGTGGSGANPPMPCIFYDPDTAPGTACFIEGESCDFNDRCREPIWQQNVRLSCVNGRWSATPIGGSCNPPAPTCPTSLPGDGTGCAFEGAVCSYPTRECCPPIDATCVGGVWQVMASSCNPPPPDPCPVTPPTPGSSCAPADRCGSPSRVCTYGNCFDEIGSEYTCDPIQLKWSQTRACSF